MTVSTFDPQTITVSEQAARHLHAQLAMHKNAHLRLGVKESGCNGYSYYLDYLDAPASNDVAIRINEDLEIHVLPDDLPMVRGTRVEFVREGLNSTLQFKNANATSYCGCGESFSIDH
mgnify:CR=1 FL=1